MVSSAFLLANSKSEGGPVNQWEGQIITEYLAVLVESRIKCETTHTSPDILTEIMASRLEPRLLGSWYFLHFITISIFHLSKIILYHFICII